MVISNILCFKQCFSEYLDIYFWSFLDFFFLITEEFICTGSYQLGNNICFKYSFQLVLCHLALWPYFTKFSLTRNFHFLHIKTNDCFIFWFPSLVSTQKCIPYCKAKKLFSLAEFIYFVSIEIDTFKLSFWYKKGSKNFILFSPEVFTVSKALADPFLTEYMGALWASADFQKTKECQVVTKVDLVVLPLIYPDWKHY